MARPGRRPHLMTAAYAAVLFALCRWHKQPWPYFFVLLIPTLMVVHVAIAEIVWRRPRSRTIALTAVVLLGVGWPLTYMPGILERDHAYQRDVVRLSHAMLDKNDTYLAGNDILYDRHQSHAALRRLSAYQIEAMHQWPPERFAALIAELEREQPKLVIDDSRMRRLPAPLRTLPGQPVRSAVFQRERLLAGHRPERTAVRAVVRWRLPSRTGRWRCRNRRTCALRRARWSRCSAALIATTVQSKVRLRLLPRGVAVDSAGARTGRRPMFARAYDY